MKKLLIEDIKQPLNFKIQKGGALDYICKLADNSKYNFDYDIYLPTIGKNLQRDFCWTLEQKQELIISLVKEINIPNIAVILYEAEDKTLTYKIIDGKQRLSTIISFFRGEFPITFDDKEYYFNDLEEKFQKYISLYRLNVDMSYEYWDDMISDDDKIRWFGMINFAGTPQDAEYLTELKNKIKKLNF